MTASAATNVMLYISAQNELSSKAEQNIQQIRSCVALDDLSTYILVDLLAVDSLLSTTVYRLDPGTTLSQFKPSEGPFPSKEMSNPAVFDRHLGKAQEHFQKSRTFPPNQQILFLWGHGGGMVMLDEQQSEGVARSQASIRDFAKVLVEMKNKRQPVAFDVIAFDACYMAMIETMNELQGCTSYALCSSTMVDADSFPYDTIFGKLKTEGKSMNPALTAAAIADLYSARYKSKYRDGSRFLFVCDMKKISAAVSALNAFGQALTLLLQGAKTSQALRRAMAETFVAAGASRQDVFVLRFLKLLLTRLSRMISDQDLSPVRVAAQTLHGAVRDAFAGNMGDTASKPISPMVWVPQSRGTCIEMLESYNKLDSSKGGRGGWTTFWQNYHGVEPPSRPPVDREPVDRIGIPCNVLLA